MKEFQLNSRLDLIGGFWPPEKNEEITSGTLSSQKGHLYLSVSPRLKRLTKDELRESMMAFKLTGKRLQRTDVLQGQTKEGRCTLLHLIESTDDGLLDGRYGVEITAPRWRVGTAVMGLHIASEADAVLDGAAFYISKIKNMLPDAGKFQMTEEGLTYTSPFKALNYFTLSSSSLQAEVICEIFSRGSSRVQSVSRIRVIPSVPQPLDWYWAIGPRLENFFSLILGTSVSLKGVQLFQGKESGWVVRRFQSREEKVDHASWVRLVPQQMVLALENWLAVPEDRRPVEKTVLNVLRKSSLFVETEFLALAQALEGFGRLHFQRGNIRKRLTFASGIEQAYDLLSMDFAKKLLGDRAQFVNEVVQTRNYFTHLGISKKAAVLDEPKDLFLLNQKLHAFIRCVMLLEIGVSEAALRDPILHQSRRWQLL